MTTIRKLILAWTLALVGSLSIRNLIISWILAPFSVMAFTPDIDINQPHRERPDWSSQISSSVSPLLFDEAASEFASNSIEAVTENWDVEIFFSLLEEGILRSVNLENLRSTFFQFMALGRPISIGDVSGGVTLNSLGTEGTFTANGHFEHGEGFFHLQVKKSRGEWYIQQFIVESPIFKEKAQRSKLPMNSIVPEKVLTEFIESEGGGTQLAPLRHAKKELGELIDTHLVNNDREAAKKALAAYVKATPNDLSRQLQLAELLDVEKGVDERRMRLEYIRRVAEDINLYHKACNLLNLPNAKKGSAPASSDSMPDVLFILGANFNRIVVEEIAETVQAVSGVRIQIHQESMALPPPDLCADQEYVSSLFTIVTNSLSPLQWEALIQKESRDVSSFDSQDKLDAIRQFLILGGHNAELIIDDIIFQKELREGLCGHNESTLFSQLKLRFPYEEEHAVSYFLFTDDQLLNSDSGYSFGLARGPYAVISSFNFKSHVNGGEQYRPLLVERLSKQVLSSLGFTLGIVRCGTPDCARAYSGAVSEYDIKSMSLCEICTQAFRRYRNTGENIEQGNEYIRIGIERMEGRDYAEAVTWLKRGLEAGSKRAMNYVNLGFCYQMLFKMKEAELAYQKALTIDVDVDAPPYVFFGNEALKKGDNELAYTNFKKASQLNPKDIGIRIGVVGALRNMKLYDEALIELREIQALAPNHPEGYELAGDVFFAKRQGEFAIQEYRKAILLNPKSHTATFNYALSIMATGGDVKEAIKYARLAIELQPDNLQYNQYLGRQLGMQGLYQEALPYLEKAITLASDLGDTWNDKGYLLLMMGRYNESLIVLGQGIKQAPSHALLHYNRALVLSKLKRFQEAVNAYEVAIQHGFERDPAFEQLKMKLE